MCPQGALVYHTFLQHRLLFRGCRGHGADCVEGRPPEPLCCTIDININRAYTKSEYEHGVIMQIECKAGEKRLKQRHAQSGGDMGWGESKRCKKLKV